MSLRVTFDTNVLDLACRPERFPKDHRQPHLNKVREALIAKRIIGFYPVTMLTIEGVMNKDRIDVYSGTRMLPKEEVVTITKNADLPEDIRDLVGTGDVETINIEYQVSQPNRQPLHPEVIARINTAHSLGVKPLKAVPRIGGFQITDPNHSYYYNNGDSQWTTKAHEIGRQIEQRGVGYAQVKAWGQKLGLNDPEAIWYEALRNAKDIHERRAIERAFSEWADGDAITSHITYGTDLDVFCSADVGNTNTTHSILDPVNRTWLTQTFGVTFITFDELLAYVERI
ncbi:hypothetical protein [Pragia fontium]|uniref:hypothetical protein n=1 Tax=Pragia fontium TaxID=82985 RepID=UPI00064B325C|nr:hypothetical protein [Pragia fontium]AKJ42293.1 hypothetical protein QQ39_09495 [Pragia fontium]